MVVTVGGSLTPAVNFLSIDRIVIDDRGVAVQRRYD